MFGGLTMIGSKRLADLILSFNRQAVRYLRLSLSTPERRRRSYANWSDLVAGLVDGNGTRSRATLATARHGNPRHGTENAHSEEIESRMDNLLKAYS
jgi:hypothetical protein